MAHPGVRVALGRYKTSYASGLFNGDAVGAGTGPRGTSGAWRGHAGQRRAKKEGGGRDEKQKRRCGAGKGRPGADRRPGRERGTGEPPMASEPHAAAAPEDAARRPGRPPAPLRRLSAS